LIASAINIYVVIKIQTLGRTLFHDQ